MTAITLDLPDDLLTRARERAEVMKISIVEMLQTTLIGALEPATGDAWDPSLTPQDIAAIEEGLADIAAGRTRPWTEVRAEMQALVSR